MMGNTDMDSTTKKLIADSYIILNDPGFTERVMHKVSGIQRRKMILRSILFFLIIVISSGLIIFFTLKTFQTQITGTGSSLVQVPQWLTAEKIIGWIHTNEYFIVPLLIVFAFKGIFDIIARRKRNIFYTF